MRDTKPNRVVVEICVDSIDPAMAANAGGADRIELCSSLAEGGLTPSAGLIATVRSKVALDIFAMVRPRAGDFCYSSDEFKAMERDVLMAKHLGVNGIVFGVLKEDGSIDIARTRRLVEIARPLGVTFHRAFDMSRDLRQSLEDLVDAGVDRVLTSGGEQNVDLGYRTIAELNRSAGDHIVVMAGSGITENNARKIVDQTGVREVHASLRTQVPSPMLYRNEKISLGPGGAREYERMVVPEERVRKLLAALQQPASVAQQDTR